MRTLDTKKKIVLLDNAFDAYIKEGNAKDLCRDLSTCLSAFSGDKKFTVSIVETCHRHVEPFFGMRVFPNIEYMTQLIETTVNAEKWSIQDACRRWKKLPFWEIEMDERIFDRNEISFTPQELTAMLLHEVGHIVYSNKTFEMFYRVYTEARIKMSSADKASSKLLFHLYLIPLTITCGLRDWRVDSNDLKEEIFADQSVTKLGYGEHLISAFDKIIYYHGGCGYKNESEMIKHIERSVDWCNLNIKDIVRRKDKIIDDLYVSGTTTNSKYLRNVITNIMNKLDIRKLNKYTSNVVMESSLSLDYDDGKFLETTRLIYDIKKHSDFIVRYNSVREAAMNAVANEAFGKSKKPEIPSQLDVDTIFVEVDRIRNHADRRYVLDLIYHQEEKINNFLELCETNDELKKKYAGKMESMLKELASMRQAVLNKRNFDKNYKVFIKYPEGYEG